MWFKNIQAGIFLMNKFSMKKIPEKKEKSPRKELQKTNN